MVPVVTRSSASPRILLPLLITLMAALALVLFSPAALAQSHGAGDAQAVHQDHPADQAGHVAAEAHGEEAAEGHGEGHHHVDPVGMLPLWTAIPFVGILLSIAVFPLVAPHFWHHHFPKVSALWGLLFALPFLIWNPAVAFGSILHIYLLDYFPFIILLWGLFTISGGIYVGGSLAGTPRVNLALLLIGTFMASLIGTTGAAMVLIRPLLRANQWRRNKVHVIVFFIFLVANIGGSLTPLGDPPLFLGFLHGVPFFWVTTGILKEMLLTSGLLLAIFFVIDTVMYRREEDRPEHTGGGVKIEGLHNGLFLLGVMGAVIMSGSLKLGEVTLYSGGAHPVAVPLQNWLKDGIILLMGLLSMQTTSRALREKNEFSWFPIQEVAYLFAGIFMTIIPALAILKAGPAGALAGLTNAVHGPVRYFWATGSLSSFLDNAPTYLTFFNSALGALGIPESQVHALLSAGGTMHNPEFVKDLAAISSGAVFMGAMTYIGNAPNFMVKSIAEEAGINMPSFFGYLLKWSLPVLIPVFIIDTFVFFW